MARPGGLRAARFGDDCSCGDIAARRMVGGSASVVVFENLGGCLEAADRDTVAMVPAHSAANKRIPCAGPVPVMGRAEYAGLRALAELELPVGHVRTSFGRLEWITTVPSKD